MSIKTCITTVVLILALHSRVAAVEYSILGGVTLSSMVFKDSEINYVKTDGIKFKLGGHVGFLVGKHFVNDKVLLQTGLILNIKGFRISQKLDHGKQFHKMNFYYADFPIWLSYHFQLANETKLYIGTGPVISMALFGGHHFKWFDTDSKSSGKTRQYIQFGRLHHNDFKRLDIGLSGHVGIERNRYRISLHFNHGLFNISTKKHMDFIERNQAFQLSVARILK